MASMCRTIRRSMRLRKFAVTPQNKVKKTLMQRISNWLNKYGLIIKFKTFILKTLFINDSVAINLTMDGKTGFHFNNKDSYAWAFNCTISNFDTGVPMRNPHLNA